MKSQNDMLLHVLCDGVFRDAETQIPGLRLCRDIQTLTRLVAERGLGVFLLDLPFLDSILTDGLEHGRLTLGGPLTRAYSKRVKVPRFISGLWLRIFNNDGVLRKDACVDSIYFVRQVSTCFKKFEIPCSRERTERSIHDYIKTDSELRFPTLPWKGIDGFSADAAGSTSLCDLVDDSVPTELLFDHAGPTTNQRHVLLLSRLQRLCDSVATAIGSYFPVCETHIGREKSGGATGLRHGPGAVSIKRDTEKYLFSNWQHGLQQCFPYDMMVWNDRQSGKAPTRRMDPSRLIDVPKTAKAPRLIAAEPGENQFCQQLTWGFLKRRIRALPLGAFIDFSRQDLSGDLVVTSSQTQELATVDLSSASDRLSCFVVERVFRNNHSILSALHSHRSRYIKLPNGDNMWLRKFASQGAAVTFPIQSIVFLCCALAACGVDDLSKSLVLKGKVRVFGDDIIVPRCHLEDLVTLLHLLQLKVNHEKSFSQGHFRESCGYDYYKGYNVTPCKLVSLDSTTVSGRLALLDQVNNTFGCGLWKTSNVLKGLLGSLFERSLPVNNLSLSPPRLFSFSGYDYSHLKMRWNRKLHVVEYKVRTFKPKDQASFLDGALGMRAFFNERTNGKTREGYLSSGSRVQVGDRPGWVSYPASARAVLGRAER